MKRWKSVGRPLAMVGVLLVFCAAGCGRRDPGSEPGPFGEHNFRLLLTDFPLDDEEVTKVLVTFNRIEIHGEETGWFTAADYGPSGRTFDLLTLQDGRTDELGAFDLAPGAYTQIRLILAEDNLIEVDDGSGPELRPLKVPSGEQTGIKLQGDFIVAENGFTQVVLDFNAEKSVHRAGDEYMLHPVIHIVSTESFPGIEILSPPDNYQTQVPHVTVTGRVTNLITGPIQNVTATFADESFPVPVQADGSFAFDLDVPITASVTALPLEVTGSDEAGHSARVIQNVIAVPAFAPEQVLVRFLPTSSPRDVTDFLSAFDGTVVASVGKIKLYEIALPAGADVGTTIPLMNGRAGVAYALPNFYATGALAPGDSDYSEQDDLRRIGAEAAWETTTGSRDIVVAVIDDGIKADHLDFVPAAGELPTLFQNPDEFVPGDGNLDGCPGLCDVDDDGDGFADCHDPDILPHVVNGMDDDGDGDIDEDDEIVSACATSIFSGDDDENGFIDDRNGWDFVDDDSDPSHAPGDLGHGTEVASIIGARASASITTDSGITGVNWEVTLLPLRVYSGTEPTTMSEIVQGLSYAVDQGADVINISLRGIFPSAHAELADLSQLFKDVNDLGTLVVMAAGNEGIDLDNTASNCTAVELESCFYFPTQIEIPNKLVVGGYSNADVPTADTNFGSIVNLSAPAEGVFVATTNPAAPHGQREGTSMAAAFVSGVAALTLAAQPDLRRQGILLRKHLLQNALTMGRIDAFKAVDTAVGPPPLLKNGDDLIPDGIRVNDTHLIPCDVDGDQDEDMVVVVGFAAGFVGEDQTLLLINGTDGMHGPFVNGTPRLDLGPGNYVGGDCGDVDNDGDMDLVLAGFEPFAPGRQDKLLINRSDEDGVADGVFADRSMDILHNVIDISRDIDLFDADDDGDLDMYISNAGENLLLVNCLLDPREHCPGSEVGNARFVLAPDALPAGEFGQSHNAVVGDIDGDGDLDIHVSNEFDGFFGTGVDQLLINQLVETGSLSFRDEAVGRGLSAVDLHNHQGAFFDADGDGCLDLVVVRRADQPDSLYFNDREPVVGCTGQFVEAPADCFPQMAFNTSTLDVGDLDGDGLMDIYLGNGDPNVFVAQQDHLLLNRPDRHGCYVERGDESEINVPQGVVNTAKHVSFIDVDRDGDCDIWTGNFGERDGLLLNTRCNSGSRPSFCDANLSSGANYCGLEVQFP